MDDELETIVAAIADAFNRRDAEGVARHWVPDAYVLPPDAPLVQGRQGLVAMIEEIYAGGVERIRFDTLTTQHSGDFLVHVGRYTMTGAVGDQAFEDRGKFVSVYARQSDGDLLITVTAFNRDQPPPAPDATD